MHHPPDDYGRTLSSISHPKISWRLSEHILEIDDTLGNWLPEYSAWKDVSIRRLLNMTSGIPNPAKSS
jgi:hypothetical protein